LAKNGGNNMKIVKKKHGRTICLKGIFEEFTLAIMPTRIDGFIQKGPKVASNTLQKLVGIEPH